MSNEKYYARRKFCYLCVSGAGKLSWVDNNKINAYDILLWCKVYGTNAILAKGIPFVPFKPSCKIYQSSAHGRLSAWEKRER